MFNRSSLRGRLTATYTSLLVTGLILFAIISYSLLDRALSLALDNRLRTAMTALAATVTPEEVGRRLEPQPQVALQTLLGSQPDGALIGAKGNVIAATDATVPPALVALARRPISDTTFADVGIDTHDVRAAIAPVRIQGRTVATALVWQTTDSIEEVERDQLIIYAVAIPVIALIAILGGGFVASRGLRPLAEVSALAQDIEAHDLSARLQSSNQRDELGRFSATFNRMLDRLAAAFERQRQFTADASHELRAPLSVIRAEAELSLRSERSSEEYRHALEAVLAESDRLEHLIGQLLAAARAESRSQPMGVVDAAAVVSAEIERISPVARARGVNLIAYISGAAWVRGHESALASACACVLHNGVDFARTLCEVALAHENGRVTICISDDGPGFSESGLAHATERFWHDDASREHSTGSGLGLAIARAIVESAGGEVRLGNGPRGGAEVMIIFPSDAQAS